MFPWSWDNLFQYQILAAICVGDRGETACWGREWVSVPSALAADERPYLTHHDVLSGADALVKEYTGITFARAQPDPGRSCAPSSRGRGGDVSPYAEVSRPITQAMSPSRRTVAGVWLPPAVSSRVP